MTVKLCSSDFSRLQLFPQTNECDRRLSARILCWIKARIIAVFSFHPRPVHTTLQCTSFENTSFGFVPSFFSFLSPLDGFFGPLFCSITLYC